MALVARAAGFTQHGHQVRGVDPSRHGGPSAPGELGKAVPVNDRGSDLFCFLLPLSGVGTVLFHVRKYGRSANVKARSKLNQA